MGAKIKNTLNFNITLLFLANKLLSEMFEGQEQVSPGSRLASHSFHDQDYDVSIFLASKKQSHFVYCYKPSNYFSNKHINQSPCFERQYYNFLTTVKMRR